jgi:hypothetical protein
VNIHIPGGDVKIPNQITRVLPPNDEDRQAILPKDVNDHWGRLVKGTVWENYMLVGTQWRMPQTRESKPQILANTTMESYKQETSSCITCHRSALTSAGGKHRADYSFLFEHARSESP